MAHEDCLSLSIELTKLLLSQHAFAPLPADNYDAAPLVHLDFSQQLFLHSHEDLK